MEAAGLGRVPGRGMGCDMHWWRSRDNRLGVLMCGEVSLAAPALCVHRLMKLAKCRGGISSRLTPYFCRLV
jgi:hypothetical protein